MATYDFNGETRIITLASGAVVLDTKDMYSRWKDWVAMSGSMYPPAFSSVGGDLVDADQGIYVTSYIFLDNNWLIRPQEATHKLSVREGVLVGQSGGDPFTPTIGAYNVMVSYSQPVKIETIVVARDIDTEISGYIRTMATSGVYVSGVDPSIISSIIASGTAAGWVSTPTDLSGVMATLTHISGQVYHESRHLLSGSDSVLRNCIGISGTQTSSLYIYDSIFGSSGVPSVIDMSGNRWLAITNCYGDLTIQQVGAGSYHNSYILLYNYHGLVTIEGNNVSGNSSYSQIIIWGGDGQVWLKNTIKAVDVSTYVYGGTTYVYNQTPTSAVVYYPSQQNLSDAAFTRILNSGNAAGWNASGMSQAVRDMLITVSGDLLNVSNHLDTASGVVRDNETLLQSISGNLTRVESTVDTVSGNLTTFSGNISSIATVSGFTPGALSQMVASGNAANWNSVTSVDLSGISGSLSTISGNIAALNNVSITTIVASGNQAGWNAVTPTTDLAGLSGSLATISGNLTVLDNVVDTISGKINTLPSIDTIVASGNTANWNSVTSVDLSGISGSLNTISGNLLRTENTIITVSGDVAVANAGIASTYGKLVVVSGDIAALNDVSITDIVASGNAANWGADTVQVTVSGMTPAVLSSIVASGNQAGWNAPAIGEVTVSGFTAPALSQVIISGNQAGWNAPAVGDVTVSGFTPAALSEIVSSGNQAGWNAAGVSGEFISTINTISGNLRRLENTVITVSGDIEALDITGTVTVSGITPAALSQIVASGNQAGWNSAVASGGFISTIDAISGIVGQFRFTDHAVWSTLHGEKVVVGRNEDKWGYTILTSNLENLLTSGGSPAAESAVGTGGNRMFNRRTGSKLFSGSSRGSSASMNEIDLRREFSETLYGSASKPQRGHWVVYRRFDLATKSAQFDEVYNTGTGGPAHAYADELVITRTDPVFSPEQAEASMPAGILKGGQYIFYFEHDFVPCQDDQIFEITWGDHRVRPPASTLTGRYVKKYNIKEVFPYRADGGRIEYWMVYVNTDIVSY